LLPAELLHASLSQWDLDLGALKEAQLLRFIDLLLQANEKFNLTSITDPAQAISKHLVDSLAPLKFAPPDLLGGFFADIGSGGGLPGIPLSLCLPLGSMILVESTQKKARFLKETVEALGLQDKVKVETERAERLGQGRIRENLDVVLARALGPLPVILELGLPLLKIGGILIAYKGPSPKEEVDKSRRALKVLGGEVGNVLEFTLPFSGEGRSLILVHKVGKTQKAFPRLPGTPAKDPLL
jgi:16S rRNA (guanine527-N7)-methyltransferase